MIVRRIRNLMFILIFVDNKYICISIKVRCSSHAYGESSTHAFNIACTWKNMYTRAVSQLWHSYFIHICMLFLHYQARPTCSGSMIVAVVRTQQWASHLKLVHRCLSQTFFKTKAWQGDASPALKKEAKTTTQKKTMYRLYLLPVHSMACMNSCTLTTWILEFTCKACCILTMK